MSDVPSFWIVFGPDSAENESRTCWSEPSSPISGLLLLPAAAGLLLPLLLVAAGVGVPACCLAKSLDWMRLAAIVARAEGLGGVR